MNVATPLIRGAQPEAADDQERAPIALPGPNTATAAGIAVLSADASLREMLGGISSALATITLVDDWAALLDALEVQGCSIVLLDADRLERSQLEARLAELHRQPASPVIIAAVGRERGKESMDALAAGRIHRLLLKPATPGGVRLAIDYAIARSRQQHPDPVSAPIAPAWPYRHRSALLLAGMAIVFAGTVLGALGWQNRPMVVALEEAPAPAPAPAPSPIIRGHPPFASELVAPPAEVPEGPDSMDPALDPRRPDVSQPELVPVEAVVADRTEVTAAAIASVEPMAVEPKAVEIGVGVSAADATDAPVTEASASSRGLDRALQRGEAHLQTGELIRPNHENAFSHYLRAAAIDPSHPGVASLRARLGEAVVVAALQALEAGDVPESEALVDAGGDLGINAVVLGDLAARVAALRTGQQAEQQAAHEAELLARGLERLNEQRLLVPQQDSAAFYLGRLRMENPQHPGLAAPWAALLATLADNARNAVAAEEFTAAEQWIEWLHRLDADATLIGALSAELETARRQRGFLDTPAPPSELVLLHSEPASYPRQALLRAVEGWVDVDFVVDRQGRPRDVEITAAEPPGFFERSAADAVSRYRYEPYVLDGRTYERRVALRLLFTLD